MKNKKNLIISVITIILIIGLFAYFHFLNNDKIYEEILPEEEISEEQYRKTMVTLYYQNKDTKELMPEVRLIDVKLLINEPYITLINLLMEKPKNENLESVIPIDTKINKIELKSDILFIDFSKEFIDNHIGGIDEEKNTIYSIVNTLSELTEVNGVKILIDNEENKSFKDNNINFNEAFFKIENEKNSNNINKK